MNKQVHFYLHIGTEKTGSTAIQTVLKNSDVILREDGYAYLYTHNRIESRSFAAAATGDKQPDDFLASIEVESIEERQAFREEIVELLRNFIAELPKSVHSVILSSEHFHSRLRQAEQVEWLHGILQPFASGFTVICYLRHQADLVASYYSTMLKNNEIRLLSEVVEKTCLPSNHYYNYEKVLSVWARVFGKSSIKPRIFCKRNLLNENVVDDFLNFIGFDTSLIKPGNQQKTRYNESLMFVGQALLRVVNKARKDLKSVGTRKEGFQVDISQLEWIKVNAVNVLSGKGEPVAFSQVKKIEKDFFKSNESVRKEWFSDLESLFESKPEDVNARYDENGSIILPMPPLNEPQLEFLEKALPVLSQVGNEYLLMLDPLASVFRDRAVMKENKDIDIGLRWMKLAAFVRPKGPFIEQKIAAYEESNKQFFARVKRFF